MRAADTDRRLRGEQLIAIAGELADLPGKRAETALHQAEDGDFHSVLPAGEVVAFDAELGIRLERNERVVRKAQLRVALCRRHDRVAGFDRRSCGERYARCTAHRNDVADGEDNLTGLREGRTGRKRAHEERCEKEPGTQTSFHRFAPARHVT